MSAGTSPTTPDTAGVLTWRRVVARLLDSVWQVPAGIVVWYVTVQLTDLHWRWGFVTAAVAVSCVQIVGETFLVWGLGTTPGKVVVGLRVCEVQTGEAPGFRAALLRAMKVVTWGMGFWLGPLALGCAVGTFWRLSTARAVSWERGGESTAIRTMPSAVSRQLTVWVAGISIMLLANMGPLLMLSGTASTSATLSQDLRRNISGQWIWLNQLSGSQLTLDSRWRLVHERMNLDLGYYDAKFAFGEGDANMVRLSVQWKRLPPTSLCINGEVDLQEMGFVVIQTGNFYDKKNQTQCTVHGGISADSVIFGKVDISLKGKAGSVVYKVFSSSAQTSSYATEAVEGLAARLVNETGPFEDGNGKLNMHFWRNGLTGEIAQLPGDWMLHEMNVSEGDFVTYTFYRLTGDLFTGLDKKDIAYVAGLAKNSSVELEYVVQQVFARLTTNKRRLSKELLPGGDIHYKLLADGQEGSIIVRSGKRYSWLLVWANSESRTALGSLEQHAFLSRIVPTLR
ncbi:RDD family protein [Pseudomonas sp. G(2018)]|uniref:RDD family protein n=1 Tax=Pseudomonas sp. G(2018) TaxID=2502242 RepID=UPI0010F8758F|nr:RDD family protein [Pseudomonas sp. G(2018)]